MTVPIWFAALMLALHGGSQWWWLRRELTCRRPHVCHRRHYPIRLPASTPIDKQVPRSRRGPRSPLSVRHVPAFLPTDTRVQTAVREEAGLGA